MAANYSWAFTTVGQGAGAWQPISTIGAPSAGGAHTAVWTGTEMIVWGDRYSLAEPQLGARYSPATDTWTAMTNVGAPSERVGHVAVWTGNEMIVCSIWDDAEYDLAENFGGHPEAEFGKEQLRLNYRQDRLQQGDQDDAGDGADVASPSAEHIGAAEHDRGDRRQEVGIAHRLVRALGPTGEQHAAKRGARA